MKLTDWKRNINVFLWNSIFNWSQTYIGIWVLFWTKYLSFGQIGLIYSLGLILSVVLELPSGALADLIGRKKTVVIGRIFGIVGYFFLTIANNFWLFLIGNMLYQANWAFESGAQSALLYDSLKENKKDEKFYKKTESDTFFYCTMTMVVGSIVGGFLYKFDPRYPYLVCTFTAIISLVITMFFQEPTIDSEKFTFKNYLKQNIEGTIHIFENKRIRAISFFSFVITFITYCGLYYLYEPRLTEGGFDAGLMGILVAGTYLSRAIGVKLIPVLDKMFHSSKVPIFLIGFQIFGSFLSFIPGKFGAISSVYSRKFLDGFRMPILNNLQNENIISKYRATALSAISLFTSLLVGLAGLVIGVSIEKYSAAKTLGIFGFIGLIIGLPLALNLANIMQEKNKSV